MHPDIRMRDNDSGRSISCPHECRVILVTRVQWEPAQTN